MHPEPAFGSLQPCCSKQQLSQATKKINIQVVCEPLLDLMRDRSTGGKTLPDCIDWTRAKTCYYPLTVATGTQSFAKTVRASPHWDAQQSLLAATASPFVIQVRISQEAWTPTEVAGSAVCRMSWPELLVAFDRIHTIATKLELADWLSDFHRPRPLFWHSASRWPPPLFWPTHGRS